MNNVVDFEHKWAKEVGRVFIAFGSIESTILSCLEVIPKDNIFKIVQGMSLSRRIDLIVEIIKDHENILSKNLSNNLLYTKELAEKRNLIAHNPLVLDVYMMDQGGIKLIEKISSMKNIKKHIYFDEIQELAVQTEALSLALFESALEYFKYLDPEFYSSNV